MIEQCEIWWTNRAVTTATTVLQMRGRGVRDDPNPAQIWLGLRGPDDIVRLLAS
jgi:hypothetical protein